MLPYSPPEEYQLDVQAERLSGGRLVIGLRRGDHIIPVVLDTAVVISDDEPSAHDNGTSLPEGLQVSDVPADTFRCIVRREGVVVSLGDRVQFTHLSENALSDVPPQWAGSGGRDGVFLGTHNSVYRFKRVAAKPLGR